MSFLTLGFTWVHIPVVFTTLRIHGDIFLCHSQLWDLLEYFGDYMGVCSYVIHNFGIYLGEIPMVFTKLGITWGNVPTLFTILEFTWVIFPFYSQLWEKHCKIFPYYSPLWDLIVEEVTTFFQCWDTKNGKAFSLRKTIYEVLRVDNFPKISQKRNFMGKFLI